MKKKTLITSLALVAGVVAVATVVPNIGHSDDKTVTVGIVGTSDQAIWKEVAKTAKQKYDITVKTKTFTDYNQPNQAVADGSIDLNAFQHVYFLDNWNQHNHNQVKAIGKTFITPIRLYAPDYKSVKSLKKGDTIAIPNDPTNEGRSLILLESAGLIDLKSSKLPTTKDIKANKKALKIKEVAADQAASALKSGSVDAAVVNTNYAQEAKIPLDSAIYVEPLNKKAAPWINVIAAKKSKAKTKAYQQVVKAYQTKKTEQVLKQHWGEAEIPAWNLKLK